MTTGPIGEDGKVEFPVEPTAASSRLDLFLAGRITDFSRNRIQRLINTGRVRVEGRAAKPGRRLAAGERVAVDLPGPGVDRPLPEPIPP